MKNVALFVHFETVSFTDLTKIVEQLKTSSCSTDSIPTRLFKDVWDTIGHDVLDIVNSSLTFGVVPVFCKHAVVEPLLKKPNLDEQNRCKYRRISKLPFLSKVLEKVVFVQLQSFLQKHDIMDVFQSGYKDFHSTETALL